MSLPTLLSKGNVVPQKWMNSIEKRKAENQITIDFIIDFIADRVPRRRNEYPKKKPKKIGDKILILKSGTGSGKSTILPPYLYNKFDSKLHKNISVTQPRRLTATCIPYQIVQYNKNFHMEKNIGYQTGIVEKKAVRGIIFMTIGVLTQQLKTFTPDEFMSKYMFVLIDEIHERDLSNEFAIYEIKKFLEESYMNPNCPFFILMSATFNRKSYRKYFDIPAENYIEVLGKSFPKEHIYAPYKINDWKTYTVNLVKKIHMEGANDYKTPFRDILVFVNGMSMMKNLSAELHKLNLDPDFTGASGYIGIVLLTSASFSRGAKEYQNLFSPIEQVREKLALPVKTSGGYDMADLEKIGGDEIKWSNKIVKVSRRVIIATNIAETGVTIDTLRYCIETGFVISAEFNPTYGINLILNKNVSQDMSEQRAGRVGRKAPGVIYYLYTEKLLESFQKEQNPSIISSDITFELLGAIIKETESEIVDSENYDGMTTAMNSVNQRFCLESKKSFNILDLDFLTFPSADSIQYSFEKLLALGFIIQLGNQTATVGRGSGSIQPTLTGFFASKLQKIKLETIKMIFSGYYYKCNIMDLITIGAFLEVGFRGISSEYRNKYVPMNVLSDNKETSDMHYRFLFSDDFIEYLFIWDSYIRMLDSQSPSNIDIDAAEKWCKNNNLIYEGILAVTKIRDEMIESFINLGYNPFWNGESLQRGEYNLVTMLKKDINSGMEEIVKIKNCIYEGYRLNTATYNSILGKYVLDYRKIPIDLINSKLISIEGERPLKILTSHVVLSPNIFNPGLYSFVAGDISVLDGFINIDDGYISSFP